MSGPNQFRPGFDPSSQQLQYYSLNIPPPPLPPRFPPSTNIPPGCIPPPPGPPSYPPLYQNTFYPFPTQTFQSDRMTVPIHRNVTPEQSSFQNTSADSITVESESQWEIDNWLLRNHNTPTATTFHQPKRDIKIYAVREKLNAALQLIKDLENAALTLNVMVKTVTPEEWDEKCLEIEGKKKELSMLLNELKLSEGDLSEVKEKLLKRSKKRARLKRRSEQWKKQNEENKIKSKYLHFQIDKWQKEMQEGVERTKREEELQKEADAVLWVVTHKKTEAARQVALLSSLQELREVRMKRLSAAGKPTSDVERQTFSTVVERLKQLWSRHLEDCQLEDQMLRGMLSEAEVRQDPVKTYKKLVLQEWQAAILGHVSSTPTTDDMLIEIRRSWDRFAVSAPTVLATPIPPGWVLPTPPSSDQWHALLKY